MRKKIIIPIVVIIALVAAGLYFLRREAEAEALVTVYGNVDIREVTLGFRVGGRIEDILFEEGEAVKKGDLLARLDPLPLQQQRDRAAAELEIRRSELDLLQSGFRKEEVAQSRARVAEAEAQHANAARTLARQEELQAGRAGTEQQLDDARARRDQAEAALQVARANLQLMEAGFRTEEIAKAEAAMRLAEAGLAEAGTRVEDTHLLSPCNGIIKSRVLEKGAIVAPGAPVFAVSIQENPWVRAYIPESSLGQIHPGMEVRVQTDSRPGNPYRGHIGFISPVAEFTPKSIHTEELRTNLVYRFRVIVEDPDDQLRQGMPVTVHLGEE